MLQGSCRRAIDQFGPRRCCADLYRTDLREDGQRTTMLLERPCASDAVLRTGVAGMIRSAMALMIVMT